MQLSSVELRVLISEMQDCGFAIIHRMKRELTTHVCCDCDHHCDYELVTIYMHVV